MKAIHALCSFEAYRGFMRERTGRAILYLLLVTFVFAIIIMAMPIVEASMV